MTDSMHAANQIGHWMSAVFAKCGVAAEDALTTSELLLRTSLRGIDSHGLARVPSYVEKLLAGKVNPRARPHVTSRLGVLHVDGDNGLGQVAATFAMRQALQQARQAAVVTCMLRNSGHLSALGIFALLAAEQGLVAIVCQQTPPIMALPGAREGAIGNNPLAFAMPVAGQAPLVFDMASSVVARGRVMAAAREERPSIPTQWALAPDGQPTTDPALALQGAMRPMAGHKGIGLAMMVACLAGSLNESAAAVTRNEQGTVSKGSAGGVGAFFLVINPALFTGQVAFDAHVADWLGHYLTASGCEARYPGLRQAQCEAQRREIGIPVSSALAAELRATGRQVGVMFEF